MSLNPHSTLHSTSPSYLSLIMISLMTLTLSFTCASCKQSDAPQASQAPQTSQESHEPKEAQASVSVQPAQSAQSKMTLTPEGTTFKPPIKPEALPSGAHYCDMGTVHYARSERGDNTCPLCKMKLTLKP